MFIFALVARVGLGAGISYAVARSSIAFCKSISRCRSVMAASKLLGAAAACVILLSFAAVKLGSYIPPPPNPCLSSPCILSRYPWRVVSRHLWRQGRRRIFRCPPACDNAGGHIGGPGVEYRQLAAVHGAGWTRAGWCQVLRQRGRDWAQVQLNPYRWIWIPGWPAGDFCRRGELSQVRLTTTSSPTLPSSSRSTQTSVGSKPQPGAASLLQRPLRPDALHTLAPGPSAPTVAERAGARRSVRGRS